MKTIQKISALLVASASFSMAGVINVYKDGEKNPSTSLNLTTIDSLTFSGKAEKKEMDISGKAKQSIKLSDIDRMAFTLKDKSKETMTVTVGEGVLAGNHTFKLSEIKNIEIIDMDSEKDMDSDGLADLDEIYKYDTNPNSADTDGDGWSDGEELADGMYSPTNPTKFNPRIADVPGLRITLKKSPGIWLNVTTSEGKNKSETITEGTEVTNTNSTSYEESRSVDIMNAWNVSTTQGVEVSATTTGANVGYSGKVTVGYNGSYTSSTGMSWGSSVESSVAESYEKAMAKETSEGSQVNGATLCMQVELKNTSDLAFTIEALKISASTYDIKDTSTLAILADLSRDGSLIWSNITLKPGESTDANFCNSEVPVELIKNLIYNTSAIVLGSSTQKITIDGGSNDFTVTYTKVAAKTADITIDYGPEATGNRSVRYQVATNYRYNPDNKGSDDMYAKTSLAELLRNAHVNFKQDSVEGPSKKKLYGLASIEEYKYNSKDNAMWYVSIQRAADLKNGRNNIELYTFSYASYDLEKILVGAGDAVHIFYSMDQDHDGVPFLTEHLFGTDDTKVDSDGDGLSDYDEINGWTKGESTVKFYTNPANEDTDGDGMNDKEDPDPTKNTEMLKRLTFKDASLSLLQVFADSLMVDSTALLRKDSAALAKKDSFEILVQAPSAFIKVVPNAEMVAGVTYTVNGKTYPVKRTVENGKEVYIFKTPLTILEKTNVTIEVKAGDGAKIEAHTLSISSALRPATNLKLGKSADRSQIIVKYDRSTDPRVKGYVILRVKKNYQDGWAREVQLPESIKNGAKIVNGGSYNGFNVFVHNDTSGVYHDPVGRGSPYYCYRVYAYTTEGDSDDPVMVFSKGTEEKFRNVGRLHLEISLYDFGGEYNYSGGARTDIWSNIGLFGTKHCDAGTGLTSWRAFDHDAGKVAHGETVIFFSEELDKNDEKPDNDTRDFSIGKEGMCLEIYIESNHPKKAFTKKISWPYENLVKSDGSGWVFGNGRSDNAPKKDENRFLVGEGTDINSHDGNNGIKYDDTDGYCGDACGGDIHAGYKFGINYYWDNDNDFY
ncbi:MAG: hypothetical protein IK012_11685 [Fibrobacter sp.]|uniref:hypothetical protein n=1 Tax=Fibrobacter sp. TaxID=35828 RepID=UPI0025BDBF4A|nr:hypothetical protein [Fibrobacter sp.]MBR4785892.1 hypothetical protein [Fibrobacter sp.]